MTPNFAEQANDYVGPMSVNVSTERRAERMEAFLAGCEHGYRVGDADAKELCHVIATQEREVSQLKARLETLRSEYCKKLCDEVSGTNPPNLLNHMKACVDAMSFTKHPQDGAKGDL